MQRDIGNEVIVAIIVVGVLAFALTFGIILSLSNTGPDSTDISRSNVATEVSSPTSVAAAPSVTATETAAETATLAATATRTRTPAPTTTTTSTRPPTTAAPTATETRVPSRTPEDTATPQPSDTDTPAATQTATRPPAATATRTSTTAPTSSPTTTPSKTATKSPTATASATATNRPAPSRTATLTPTPKPPTATATEESSVSFCIAPFGWVVYVAQPDNTLLSIARATGTTTQELRVANCLSDTDHITAGQAIYVPRPPVGPVMPVQPGSGDLVAQGCTYPGTVMTSPVPGQRVTGVFVVRGTATLDNFAYYRLEIRPDAAETFNFYSRSETQVVNDVLGAIDSSIFSPGLYWVRLSVIDNTGSVNTTPCTIPVLIG